MVLKNSLFNENSQDSLAESLLSSKNKIYYSNSFKDEIKSYNSNWEINIPITTIIPYDSNSLSYFIGPSWSSVKYGKKQDYLGEISIKTDFLKEKLFGTSNIIDLKKNHTLFSNNNLHYSNDGNFYGYNKIFYSLENSLDNIKKKYNKQYNKNNLRELGINFEKIGSIRYIKIGAGLKLADNIQSMVDNLDLNNPNSFKTQIQEPIYLLSNNSVEYNYFVGKLSGIKTKNLFYKKKVGIFSELPLIFFNKSFKSNSTLIGSNKQTGNSYNNKWPRIRAFKQNKKPLIIQ